MALYPYLPPTARENRVLLTPFVMLAEAAASNPQVYLLVFRYLQLESATWEYGELLSSQLKLRL